VFDGQGGATGKTSRHHADGRHRHALGLPSLGSAIEFGSFGEPTGDRERAEILDEGLAILDGLWSGEPVTIDGRHHRIDGVRFLPRPVQRPRIPVWVAGMWPNRAPFRRAARWDGVFPIVVVDGEPSPIPPEAFAEALAFTRSLRESDAPFDAVVQGAPDTDPGDYAAAARLFDTHGIHFDAKQRDEVVARVEALNLPSYTGFVMPKLTPVIDASGKITDVTISYPLDLTKQMLEFAGTR